MRLHAPSPAGWVIAVPLLALALAGCTGSPPPVPCTYTPVSGFADLHGLAVDPEHPEMLFAATHHGLFRAVNDTGWARVGSMADDLMGFTMHPTNGSTVWVSGHPATGGNMGVRISRDGGCNWKTIAARDWDFHAMTVSPANPDIVWGFYRAELRRSSDGGSNWEVLSKPAPIAGLAGDPKSADTVYATTQQGLQKSTDGGRTWQTLNQTLALGLAVDPTDPQVLYRGGQGFAEKSTDGGSTWSSLRAPVGGGIVGYIAINPKDPKVVYVGTAQTGIYKTTDGGATWKVVKPPSG